MSRCGIPGRSATRTIEDAHSPVKPASQVSLLAFSQLLVMTLWFSATAVMPALEQAWQLGPTGRAWLTASVQLGFVAGALVSAMCNLPDLVAPRRLIAVAALGGAVANLVLALFVSSLAPALVLRFATGVCLAGVYPPGMKVAAGHVTGRSRGTAIGVLVGALTLGSATPHLVAGWDLPHRMVLAISSALAVVGALIVSRWVGDGPHAAAPVPFDRGQIGRVLRNRSVSLANLGYCGHMWELYAMWTWLVTFLAASLGEGATNDARLLGFVSIGVAGAFGAAGGGWLADRWGRTRLTVLAMAVSGACCLAAPAVYGAATAVLLLFGLVWGVSIIADSAQFSAAVTELADPAYVGTALTLQTSLGFALTMVTIWGLPELAELVGWRWTFVALAPGPLLGCWAMARLRAHPDALKLAGGRR